MVKKKILIFSHEFPPEIGGAGMVAQQYARNLANRGFHVTVLTCKRDHLNYNDGHILKAVKTLPKVWFLSYINAINYNQFDSIILNDPAAVFFAGLFFTDEQLAKSTVILHGSEPENIFEKPLFSKKIFRFKSFYTKALKKCKNIIAVSKYMKEKFLTRTHLKILRNKINIIYTPIDNNLFFEDKNNQFRQSHNIATDSQVLLSVGRIVKQKGYFDMLEIFKELVSDDKNFVWIVVGDGTYLSQLKQLVKDANLESNIIFVGTKNRSELRHYYSNADVFWLLSNFDESFGLVYLEAQACGCPVIGRNRAGTIESIESNVSGFLVNSKEEVLDILQNKRYLNFRKKDIVKVSSRISLDKKMNILEKLI